ncbi:MAG: hypothetical protein HKP30_10070, partial [Myxococcales bacterium]|nr:hypothetical protein [Myxococcales bacterium]
MDSPKPQFVLMLALTPALMTLACGDTASDEARRGLEAPTGEPERVLLPEPDPDGITFYPWEDVYAAGRLDWAWAIASDHGNLEQLERLLADGVDPDVLIGGDYQRSSEPRRHGRTALIEAAWLGYEEVARRLLEAGADPLAREISEEEHFGGDTALHKAASQGHAGIARLLLEAGTPVDVAGQGGATPLKYAHDEPETFRLLQARGADLEKAGGATQLLHGAASSRSTEMAALLLALGAEIEGVAGKRQYGYTPLWSAAVGGYEEMTLFLLEQGADPHVKPY